VGLPTRSVGKRFLGGPAGSGLCLCHSARDTWSRDDANRAIFIARPVFPSGSSIRIYMSFPQQRRAGQPRLHPPCRRVKARACLRSKFHSQLPNFPLHTVFEQIKHVGSTSHSSSIRRRPTIGPSFSAFMAPWNAACSTMDQHPSSRTLSMNLSSAIEKQVLAAAVVAPAPAPDKTPVHRFIRGAEPGCEKETTRARRRRLEASRFCAARDRRRRQHPAARGLPPEHRELCGHDESAGRHRRPFAGQRPFCRRRLHGPLATTRQR